MSKIKDVIYDTIALGETSMQLYPLLMSMVHQMKELIKQSDLSDKSVFSQISASMQAMPTTTHGKPPDGHLKKKLEQKEKQIRRL